MWPWGALPLRPPPHEAVGTCRVAWDALPLLPQVISASYLGEEGREGQEGEEGASRKTGLLLGQVTDLQRSRAPSAPFLLAQSPAIAVDWGWRAIRHLSLSVESQTRAGCRRPVQCLSPSLERQTRARRQATDPGPSPELGKADTRSGEGPGSVAASRRHLSKFSAEPENLHGARSARRIQRRVRHESSPPFRRTGVSPSVIAAAPGRMHAPCGFSGPGENPLMAPAHERSIRHLSPSACLPFQARGKVPDRPPVTRACPPFRAPVIAPD